VRVSIVGICEKNKIKEAIPALKEMMNSPKTRFRPASVRALGEDVQRTAKVAINAIEK